MTSQIRRPIGPASRPSPGPAFGPAGHAFGPAGRAFACLLLAMSACAGAPTAEQQAREEKKQETIDQILTEPLAAEDYAAEERCLSTHAYRSIDIIDDQHVLFRGSGDKLWINTLRHKCVGLRPDDTLRFELRDNRICDLDRFESVENFGFISRIGASCTLGKFAPITPEQVEAIEVAVEEARGG